MFLLYLPHIFRLAPGSPWILRVDCDGLRGVTESPFTAEDLRDIEVPPRHVILGVAPTARGAGDSSGDVNPGGIPDMLCLTSLCFTSLALPYLTFPYLIL